LDIHRCGTGKLIEFTPDFKFDEFEITYLLINKLIDSKKILKTSNDGIFSYYLNNTHNTYNEYNEDNYPVSLSRVFEWHSPENVVDQMNDVLVQHENLLCDSSFGRVAEIKSEIGQAHANGRWKRQYLQFDKGPFAGGVPYRHLKVLDQEWTNHLIQDQEQEIPGIERNKCSAAASMYTTNKMPPPQDWS
jgi:hypothetical protein